MTQSEQWSKTNENEIQDPHSLPEIYDINQNIRTQTITTGGFILWDSRKIVQRICQMPVKGLDQGRNMQSSCCFTRSRKLMLCTANIGYIGSQTLSIASKVWCASQSNESASKKSTGSSSFFTSTYPPLSQVPRQTSHAFLSLWCRCPNNTE